MTGPPGMTRAVSLLALDRVARWRPRSSDRRAVAAGTAAEQDPPMPITTYDVEVTGPWLDPRTRTTTDRVARFRVAASGGPAAELAAIQLFGSAADRERCVANGRR